MTKLGDDIHEGFYTACLEQNSLNELLEALDGPVDESDMKTWQINETEWRATIRAAADFMLSPEWDSEN